MESSKRQTQSLASMISALERLRCANDEDLLPKRCQMTIDIRFLLFVVDHDGNMMDLLSSFFLSKYFLQAKRINQSD